MSGINWVSVSEILPAENTPVIVYFAERGTTMTCHFIKDFSLVAIGLEGFSMHGVTHWAEITPPESARKP